MLPTINTAIENIIKHLISNHDHALSRDAKITTRLVTKSKTIKSRLHQLFRHLPTETIEHGTTYIYAVDYLHKIANATHALAVESSEYALNQHPDLNPEQQEELYILQENLCQIINEVTKMISSNHYATLSIVHTSLEDIIIHIDDIKNRQLRRIKQQELGVRNTTLYLNIILEIKNIAIYLQKITKHGSHLEEE
ncbi:MAG: hypothetical protein H6766_00485 [Candidatus Peribacteria bacterium]|nr:MAG: hypothetical protein H6766_00485 [Candidatus Peribacteria bacterium]